MFKKDELVIYPVYGAGNISKIYQEEIGEGKIDYYEITLQESTIDVSIPVDGSNDMGLRKPLSKKTLVEKLTDLWKAVEVDEEIFGMIDSYSKEKLKTGKVEDTVHLVNVLQEVGKKKDENNKNLSFSEARHLERALSFLRSEVKVVLGEKAITKYELGLE